MVIEGAAELLFRTQVVSVIISTITATTVRATKVRLRMRRRAKLWVECDSAPTGRGRKLSLGESTVLSAPAFPRSRSSSFAAAVVARTVGEDASLVVSDDYQNQGLGRRLCDCLFEIGRAAGAQRIVSVILPENYAMRVLSKRLGCNLEFDTEHCAVRTTLELLSTKK